MWRFPFSFDARNIGRRTTLVTPLEHTCDSPLWPLEHGFDAAILEISDPPLDAPFPGSVSGRRPIVHTLDSPGDEDVCTDSIIITAIVFGVAVDSHTRGDTTNLEKGWRFYDWLWW